MELKANEEKKSVSREDLKTFSASACLMCEGTVIHSGKHGPR